MADRSRNDRRLKRHQRVRKHVFGTPEKPRMCVFRSNANISAQIIDDVNGKTLVSASSLDKDLKKSIAYADCCFLPLIIVFKCRKAYCSCATANLAVFNLSACAVVKIDYFKCNI